MLRPTTSHCHEFVSVECATSFGLIFVMSRPYLKNVGTSDKSWEPGTFSNFNSLTNVFLSHSLSLDMLNHFCFHVYAQKSLFKVFLKPPDTVCSTFETSGFEAEELNNPDEI